jgi:hypothetical protein
MIEADPTAKYVFKNLHATSSRNAKARDFLKDRDAAWIGSRPFLRRHRHVQVSEFVLKAKALNKDGRLGNKRHDLAADNGVANLVPDFPHNFTADFRQTDACVLLGVGNQVADVCVECDARGLFGRH